MSIEHLDGAGLAPTHRGFSGPRPPQAPPAKPRFDPRALMIVGVLGSVALGLALGLWTKPARLAVASAPEPMRAASALSVGQVEIQVKPVKPSPPPKADGPLEVLPAEMAAAAPKSGVMPLPNPLPAAAAPPPPEASPARPIELAEASATRPVARARPSFSCAGALSYADELVCGDVDLAVQDRRMARAYRRAMDSTPSTEALRAEQADWRDIREDAAQTSPRALAQVYDQRIRELEDAAADWSRDEE